MKKICVNMLFLIGVLTVSCGKKQESILPASEKITESVYASGMIKTKNQYQVYASVNGIIQQILVKEGDLVKKGDPLLLIKNETSRLNTENAQLAADFSALNTQHDRLNDLKGTVEMAKSRMLNDSVMLERQRGLWNQQIGAKVELEQRELAYQSSLNNYRSAQYRYRDLEKQLRFSAEQSRKLLSISQQSASDFVVRSQTDGRVYTISKEPGEMVSPQMPLAVIGDAHEFLAELQIDENDIAEVVKGQKVLLSMDSYQGQVFEATVDQIVPMMNERTRTFMITATFVKKPPVLYPNLTAEANILIREKGVALTIPRAYLINDTAVMLENKTTRRVKTGLKDYQKVEITEGLSAQDKILKPVK